MKYYKDSVVIGDNSTCSEISFKDFYIIDIQHESTIFIGMRFNYRVVSK